jgi:hypothetical protein
MIRNPFSDDPMDDFDSQKVTKAYEYPSKSQNVCKKSTSKIYRVFPKPGTSSKSFSHPTESLSDDEEGSNEIFDNFNDNEDFDDEQLFAVEQADSSDNRPNARETSIAFKNPGRHQEKLVCENCKQSFLYKVSLLVHQKSNQCVYHLQK